MALHEVLNERGSVGGEDSISVDMRLPESMPAPYDFRDPTAVNTSLEL